MERMLIENRARNAGYSLSSFMVKSSLNNSLKILTEEEKKAYSDLATYHTNFSRISSLLQNGSPIRAEVQEVMKEIKEALKRLPK